MEAETLLQLHTSTMAGKPTIPQADETPDVKPPHPPATAGARLNNTNGKPWSHGCMPRKLSTTSCYHVKPEKGTQAPTLLRSGAAAHDQKVPQSSAKAAVSTPIKEEPGTHTEHPDLAATMIPRWSLSSCGLQAVITACLPHVLNQSAAAKALHDRAMLAAASAASLQLLSDVFLLGTCPCCHHHAGQAQAAAPLVKVKQEEKCYPVGPIMPDQHGHSGSF